ncbi:branched-chain amino acid ABC transporter permease [Cellulomonas bogoriensis]|uniref:ABC transporter permease n=1 Tax=Cellulomonas bogoriensis 69B4 = DSM 16987 TaxID=1386082 RepID=A0A0A0C2P2_9CELL|nr:branched-chain amino acid ABC transporter permease [Cellulomonas bogoriensis]KGM14465.1 ABC transporter permease [Cellulomonas bogoriensis 69B4 = DSM 16987]
MPRAAIPRLPQAPPRPGGTLRPALLALVVLTLTWAALLATGTAHAATGECTPAPDTGCVAGTVRTSEREPATDVRIVIEGPSGELETSTGPDGRWSIATTEPGEHTVTLDEDTLPDGETLRDPAANPRTVSVELGTSAAVLFPLGDPGPDPTPSPGTADDTADVPDPDAVTSPPPDSRSGSGITWERVAQQASSGLVFGTLLALASVGLSLIFGTTGLSNFAHGEQVTLGGILAYVFTQIVGLPLLVSAIIAIALAAASGWLQDAAIWRPLRRRRVGLTQQLIVTIGLAIALQYVFQFFLGSSSLRIVRTNPETLTIGPVTIAQQSLISLGIAALALAAVGYLLTSTRVGRATRAVSDNPALAAASGIGVDRIIRIVWTVGAGLAGLGGVLLGLYLNATAWNMGQILLLLMFAAVTLGGLGTAFGALAGSLVIGMVVELSNLVIPSDMRYVSALVILILVLLLRPQGILGRAERIG